MINGEVETCSGYFYDSGGFDNHYGNNEDLTYTICPDEDNRVIVLDFEAFITEANADVLYIYRGTNTAGPLLMTLSGHVEPFRVAGHTASGGV
ncbi:hypothetical protein QNH98_06690 [Myroides sp. mNGS23_01]|nr:CUB domain-containing protein [Myroides sp. mNGS23_01]WHT40277.1 hypothetical protein QNH98_06690 [Myroides sp. mNGS23_01]